jgi:hypothetical protein
LVPRFASEELADEEFAFFESRKVSEHPSAVEKHALKEGSSEPSPFDLEPQPVLVEQASEPRHTVPARTPMIHSSSVIHSSFDESFDEEYARLVPGKPVAEREVQVSGRTTLAEHSSEANGQDSARRTEGESHLENLDIPAFLRRQ